MTIESYTVPNLESKLSKTQGSVRTLSQWQENLKRKLGDACEANGSSSLSIAKLKRTSKTLATELITLRTMPDLVSQLPADADREADAASSSQREIGTTSEQEEALMLKLGKLITRLDKSEHDLTDTRADLAERDRLNATLSGTVAQLVDTLIPSI